MPKVSVIIPVYNGERYLAACLDSVCAQSLRDLEILCVDDGSTDGTPEILRSYAARDGRVRVLTQRNINAGAARNLGMRYATGEFFSFLDADDFFEPDMLESAVKRAEETDAEIVVFDSDSYQQELGVFEKTDKRIVRSAFPAGKDVFAAAEVKDLFSAVVGWPWDKLFRASYIRSLELSFQEQRTTNDLLFVYAALARAERIALLDRVLAHYRRTGSDSLSFTREKSWFCFYTALLALRARLIQWGLFERYEQDFVNYCVVLARWQLETLAQPVRDILVYMLGRAWFEQLGVTGRDESYFYDKKNYAFYRSVMESAPEILSAPRRGAGLLRRAGSRLAGGLRCVRDHGLGYTLRLVWIRLKKR